MSTEDFGESEFRIAVWFGRELDIGRWTQRTNAFDRADSPNGDLFRRSDLNPIGHAIKC